MGGSGVRRTQIDAVLEVKAIYVKVAHVEVEFEAVVVGLFHDPRRFFGGIEDVVDMGFDAQDDVLLGTSVGQFGEAIADPLLFLVP